MSQKKDTFNVGSRKSELALIQTNIVIQQLNRKFADKKFEVVTMTTTGDQILDKPLPKIGEKSLFTKELEVALDRKEVDFVVHSLKDLPTTLPAGLTIGAILKREDPRDAVVLHHKHKSKTLQTLPESSVIGTSSLRRTAQLARNFPHLKVENIRGNLNTRLKKLDHDDKYSGIILAKAGLERMNWKDRISQVLEPKELLYAVGQGALAVECRSGDDEVLEILETLNHPETILKILAERSFLKTLGGGCTAPVAVNTTITDRTLTITGAVWSIDGRKTIQKTHSVGITLAGDEPPRKFTRREPKVYIGLTANNVDAPDLNAAEKVGTDLALDLISEGASAIIGEAKVINELPEEYRKKAEARNGNSGQSNGVEKMLSRC